MPTGRTTVAYAPALTPEEEAALAAEQAAAAPAPAQTTMYQPSSPPPAEPVAAPAPAQTEMYQPSSPPPAATEPYTSISPQVTDTSNPSVEPGYSAPPSERYDDATAVNTAYQPAPMWSSPSPQVNSSQFSQTPSEARDPLLGGGTISYQPSAMAASNNQFQADQTAQAVKANRAGLPSGGFHGPGSGKSTLNNSMWESTRNNPIVGPFIKSAEGTISDIVNTDPAANRQALDNIRNTDPAANRQAIADIIPQGLKDFASLFQEKEGVSYVAPYLENSLQPGGPGKDKDVLDAIVRGIEDHSIGHPVDISGALAAPLRAPGALINFIRDQGLPNTPAGNMVEGIGTVAVGPNTGQRAAENVEQIHQVKQDFDKWVAEREGIPGQLADSAADQAGRFGGRVKSAAEGTEDRGGAVVDFLNYPLPSFGMEAPTTREIDLQNPELSWVLTPGAVARQAGFQAGEEGRRLSEAEIARQSENAQRAKGAAIGSRLSGGTNLDAALAAANAVGVPEVNLPNVSLSDYIPTPEPVPYDPLSSAYVPREPLRGGTTGTVTTAGTPGEAVTPGKIQGRTLTSQELAAREPNAALAGTAGSVRTSGTGQNEGPVLLQRAREAATAAKNWAGGLDMPDINLPSLPNRGSDTPAYDPLSSAYVPNEPTVEEGAPLAIRRTGPEGIDPNALYMPEAPPPTLMDRVRGVGSDIAERLPDVNMPDVSMPDVNISLPGRGGTPIDAGQRWAPPSQNTTTGPGGQATDPLQQVFEEQGVAGSAVRSATLPEGTSAVDLKGYTWVKGPNGDTDIRGIVDPSTGEYLLFPEGADQATVDAIVDSVVSKGGSAPGPATAAPATTTTGTNTGTATGSTTTTSSSNGSGGGSTSSGGSTGRTTRSSGKNTSYSDDDDDYDDAPLKLEDFISDFDGDGIISKRDRMQGKQAFEQAKMARSKKRRGKTTGRKGTNSQFPFNERRSALGQQIARDVSDALSGKS